MKEAVRQEIIYDLDNLLPFLKAWPQRNIEELKTLSDHAIEDVALYKNLDVISITVLIYSLYKVLPSLEARDILDLYAELDKTRNALTRRDFPKYNIGLKRAFGVIKNYNSQVRVHLQDVMQAARIKKGTALLEHGLSIGQAAGLMGLSNWDLQDYASKTVALGIHTTIPVQKRLKGAFKIFNIT